MAARDMGLKGKKKDKSKKRKNHQKKGTAKEHRKLKKRNTLGPFNNVALENSYYVCHNVSEYLTAQGYHWEQHGKKKKRGKKT